MPCAYDSNVLATLGVRNHQEVTAGRPTEYNPPLFLHGMFGIWNNDLIPIGKDQKLFANTDLALSQRHSIIHLELSRSPANVLTLNCGPPEYGLRRAARRLRRIL